MIKENTAVDVETRWATLKPIDGKKSYYYFNIKTDPSKFTILCGGGPMELLRLSVTQRTLIDFFRWSRQYPLNIAYFFIFNNVFILQWIQENLLYKKWTVCHEDGDVSDYVKFITLYGPDFATIIGHFSITYSF